jgi:hypothetical protein
LCTFRANPGQAAARGSPATLEGHRTGGGGTIRKMACNVVIRVETLEIRP